MAKDSADENRGAEEEGRISRILRRAREFYDEYTYGLKRGDFKRLFTQETRGIFQHFGSEKKEEQPQQQEEGKIKRALRNAGRVFLGFLLAMSPARRILYGISFIIFAVASVVIITAPPGSGIREDIPVLLIYGFIIVTFLLSLELADKLSARDEIEIARDVQLSLLPPKDLELKDFEVASFASPAADVGGDYHDFVEVDGDVCIAIGDVSGHGLAAGLVMAMAKSAFQAQLLNDSDPRRVLTTLNAVVQKAGDNRTLMTFLYCRVDRESGRMWFANAGHVYPLFSRPSEGILQWLETSSYPLGVRSDLKLECREVQLQPGDHIYLISDGLIEAIDEKGDSYGYSRFLESVRRHGGGKPAKALEGILDDLGAFAASGPREDDITLIIARYSPEE